MMTTMNNRRTTIKDIALRLGISCKAVSMGINGTGRLGKETRERILATAKELNYTPNVAARSLVMQKSYLIGAVLPYINTSFFSNIIAGIEDVTDERDFSLLLRNYLHDADSERQAFERVLKRKVDGMIICPREELADFYLAIAAGLPVVQIMDHLPELGDHYVAVDNESGARTAVRHLLELGHRNIGYLAHDGESISMRLRHRGYDREMRQAKLAVNPAWVEDCYMSIDTAETAAHRLLERAPEVTAIFAASDYAALGAVRAGLNRGRRIPDDLSVVGFDDLEIASRQILYPLTTIAQPKERIGTLAGQMLLDILQGEETRPQLLEAPLVIRSTTRARK